MTRANPAALPSASETADRRRSARRMLLMRLGSVVLGLLVALSLAEGVVRVFGIHPARMQTKRMLINESDPSVQYHCYPSNPHGEFQPVPDLRDGNWKLLTYTFEPVQLPLEDIEETPWCVRYDFSSQLIRDREYPPDPPAGVARIAMVGDSFVFGEGVPLDRTLPRQVESLLGTGFEVINGGVVGADTVQEIQVLDSIVREAGCSRAIVVFIPNDISLTRPLARQQEYINDLIVLRDSYLDEYESRRWYTGHLRLFHIIGSQLTLRRVHRETIQWYRDCYDPRHNRLNLLALAADLRALADRPDCQVAFVIYPLLEGMERNYPLKDVHETVSRMARAAGLPVLDLAETLEGHRTESLWVHPADRHPNGRAHAIAAEAIVEWLQRDVPGFLEE
jgi:hypothetical protein